MLGTGRLSQVLHNLVNAVARIEAKPTPYKAGHGAQAMGGGWGHHMHRVSGKHGREAPVGFPARRRPQC